MVHPKDWNLQRILWRDDNVVHTFQLMTVNYGFPCVSHLSQRTLDYFILDEELDYLKKRKPLRKNRENMNINHPLKSFRIMHQDQ